MLSSSARSSRGRVATVNDDLLEQIERVVRRATVAAEHVAVELRRRWKASQLVELDTVELLASESRARARVAFEHSAVVVA